MSAFFPSFSFFVLLSLSCSLLILLLDVDGSSFVLGLYFGQADGQDAVF